MATLEDVRFQCEREVSDLVESPSIINWCNQLNMEIGTRIDIPATTTISLTATDISYTLPADFKIEKRLSLQSWIDEGYDKELNVSYRKYNGSIIFPSVFWCGTESLVLDYYKNFTYYTSITDTLDVDARFLPVYVYWCNAKYYRTAQSMQRLGEQQALAEYQTANAMYNTMKNNVISYYSMSYNPDIIQGSF